MTGRARVVIVEPGLRDMMGHYFNFSYLIAQECRSRRLPCLVLANRDVSNEVIKAFPVPVMPFFRMGTYYGFSEDPISGELEDYLQVNQMFLEDFEGLTPLVSSTDLLLVPTASERITAACAGWLAALPSTARPRIALSFSFNPQGVGDPLRVQTLRMLYRAGLKAVAESPARHWITLMTNSVSDDYGRLAEASVGRVPIGQPSRYLVERFGREWRPGQTVTIAVLGLAAARKGFHLLPEIVARLMDCGVPVQFQIQVYGYGPEGGPLADLVPVVHALDALALRHPRAVKLLKGPLSLLDYYRVLGRAPIVLAAYSPEYDQISGVFHEAVAFGKAVVAREGSAAAEHGREINAAMLCFSDYSAVSVAEAIMRAVENLPTLLAAAQPAAEAWRQARGAGPYLDAVLEHCAKDAAAEWGPHAGEVVRTETWGDLLINPDRLTALRTVLSAEPDGALRHRVLDVILCHLGWNTGLLEMDRLSLLAQTGASARQAARAMARLVALGALHRRRLGYALDPDLAWRGSPVARNYAAAVLAKRRLKGGKRS